MARMYSRKHGKSGSTRPHREENPDWVDLSMDEVKKEVVKLAKDGRTASQIGMVLRDKYGVPSVKYLGDETITDILEDEGLGKELPEDLRNLLRRAEEIREHLSENPKDSSAIHGLEETESKIRRLGKYYKKEDRIPEDWKYEPEKTYHKRV